MMEGHDAFLGNKEGEISQLTTKLSELIKGYAELRAELEALKAERDQNDINYGLEKADHERTKAELAAFQKDAERLDYLDSLTQRTEYINKKLNNSHVNSDMHFSKIGCVLYLRDCYGKVVKYGSGDVRKAIDEAMK